MAYSSITNIQYEFKDVTFSSSTAMTTAKVTQYMADADAEIDCTLAVKYTTPITGTQSLVLIGQIAVWLVKDRINETLQVKTGDDKTSQTGGKSYRQKAVDMLNDLASGKKVLTDAALKTSADGVQSYNNNNSDDDDTANVFQRGVDQW